ncbi:MAG: 5-formyltetrahydrofolate cyclo-ligase [Rhodococcus sp. (in: high G+C Gram-positive bacteria)]
MTDSSKLEWRTRILAARRRRDHIARERASQALSHAVEKLVRQARTAGTLTVAAYVPVGTEPGGVSMLDAALSAGVRVILPIARRPGPMSWAEYRGPDSLVPAEHGLREPTGPILPPETVTEATMLLIPALAVDLAGGRLGRGAGFYDRTLHAVDPAASLIAVVYDDEVVGVLPTEAHDVRMTHVLTPGGGVRALGQE